MNENNYNHKISSILIIILMILSGLILIFPNMPLTHPVRAVSQWDLVSYEDFNNGTLDNLTIKGSLADGELKLSRMDDIWTKKKGMTVKPDQRCGHAMASIWGTDKVLMFGGADNYYVKDMSFYSDTWVYDLSNNSWTRMWPKNKPEERYIHTMVSIWGTDKVLLRSGYDINYGFYNDTWIYDLSDNNWTQIWPETGPKARIAHAMASVQDEKKVVLFGGYYDDSIPSNPSIYYNDTWVLDLDTYNWTKQNPVNHPFGRCTSMESIPGTDNFVLFGGYRYYQYYPYNVTYFNDTWIYDLSEDSWELQKPLQHPDARAGQAMAPIPGTDNVVLFGGVDNYTRVYGDTCLYDLSDRTWSYSSSQSKPNPRYSSAMASVYGQNKTVLFGGTDAWWGFKVYYDTWVFSFNLDNHKKGVFTSNPYDTNSNSAFNTITWEAVTPTATNIKFQIRTAAEKSDLKLNEFLGPDGTTSSYYSTSGESIWPGHYNDRWVQYRAVLSTTDQSKSPILQNVSIAFNNLPNTKLLSPADGIITLSNKPTFTWNYTDMDSEGHTAFQVLIDDNSTFDSIDYDSTEQNLEDNQWHFPAGTDYIAIADGKWFWKVRIKDINGDWGPYSTPWSIVIDTTHPSSALTLPVNNGCYKSLKTISGEAADPFNGTGLSKVEISIERLVDNACWTGTTWAAGTIWHKASGTAEWSFNSKLVQWESGKMYRIRSRAFDTAENVEIPGSGNTFIIDFIKPHSTVEFPKNNVYINNLENITGTALDKNGSGLDQVEISIKRTGEDRYWDGIDWMISQNWLAANGTDAWYYEISDECWDTGFQYIISSRVTDNAGNVEVPGVGNKFIYDDEPPSLSISINDGSEYSTSKEVELQLESIDTCSSVNLMAFSTDGTNWTVWEEFDGTKDFTLTDVDGTQTVYFRVKDHAGNIAEPVYDSIILDTTPPGNLSVKINNNAEYTNSTTVSLDLNAVDNLSGLSKMSFGYDGYTWTRWEPFNKEKYIKIPDGDGKKTVYFRVSDNAGNIAVASDSIILDTKPPHNLMIFINKGAEETNSLTVTLDLNAVDDGMGVSQMAFSSDGSTWSAWEDYTETRSYNLTAGDGLKFVYFKVNDRAGNTADVIVDTILLNTTTIPEVEQEEQSGEKEIKSEIKIMGLVIVIIIIIVLLIVVVFLKRRKTSGEVDKSKAETETATETDTGTDTGMLPEASMIKKPGTGNIVVDAAVIPPQLTAEPVAAPVQSLPLHTDEPASPEAVSQPVTQPQVQLSAPAPAQVATQDQSDNDKSNEGR